MHGMSLKYMVVFFRGWSNFCTAVASPSSFCTSVSLAASGTARGWLRRWHVRACMHATAVQKSTDYNEPCFGDTRKQATTSVVRLDRCAEVKKCFFFFSLHIYVPLCCRLHAALRATPFCASSADLGGICATLDDDTATGAGEKKKNVLKETWWGRRACLHLVH